MLHYHRELKVTAVLSKNKYKIQAQRKECATDMHFVNVLFSFAILIITIDYNLFK